MIKSDVLRKWNIGMSLVQFIMGVFLFFIYRDKELFNKEKNIKLTGTGVIKKRMPSSSKEYNLDWVQKDDVGEINLATLVVSFFVITGAFHGLYAGMGRSYDDLVYKNNNNYLRWIEYSISATIMINIIALQAGIRDRSTLELLTGGTIGLMLQGQIVEASLAGGKKLTNNEKSCILTATISGWVIMIANFYVIVKQYMSLDKDIDNLGCEGVAIPDFVFWIIVTQLLFYSTFGFIQIYQIYQKLNGKRTSYSVIERMYLIDSLLAKVTLGAMLAYSVIGAEQGAYAPFKCK